MKSDICNDGYTREFPRLSLSPRQANNIALVTRYLFFVGHINCFIKTLFYGVGASFCQTSKFLAWIEAKVFKQSQQFLFLELAVIGPIVGLSGVCLFVFISVVFFLVSWVWLSLIEFFKVFRLDTSCLNPGFQFSIFIKQANIALQFPNKQSTF